MRLLIAIHGYPPTHYAGAERVAERIARWMAAHGHSVEVFALEKYEDPNIRMETAHENGLTIHRGYVNVKGGGDTFQNLYQNPQVADLFRKLLQQNHYDLVHMVSGYMLGGQIIDIAHEFGIPVAVTLTEFWFMCFRLNFLDASGALCEGSKIDDRCVRCLAEDQRRFRLPAQKLPRLMNAFWSVARHTPLTSHFRQRLIGRREILRKSLQSADLVISPSHFLISKFAEGGYDTSRFVYIRHGMEGPQTPIGRDPRPTNAPLRLGYVGQIKPHKGVDLLIDAVLPLLDEGHALTLDLWGGTTADPEYVAGLQARTANTPAISWRGSYSVEQTWSVLSSFDILLVPSRWYENSPSVIAEAFTVGVPVVATRLGGMKELIEHEKSGLLFELNDADDLRRQLRRLLTEPDFLSRLRAGIPPVPSVDDEIGAIYSHYQELIAGAHVPA